MGFRGGNQHQSGFTLIEMVLVVAILGIILMISLPRYSTNLQSKKETELATKKLTSTLRLTQQLAIANKQNYYLSFSGNTYQIYQSSVVVGNEVEDPETIDNSIVLSGDTLFGFGPNSQVLTGTGTGITLTSSDATWQISITPATGRVKYEDITP